MTGTPRPHAGPDLALLNHAAWGMFAAMGEVRRFAVAGLEEAAWWAGRPGDRASDETGQQNKGEGSCRRRLLGGVRRWHRVAARVQCGVILTGKQFVDSRTMQACSPGATLRLLVSLLRFREIRPY